MQPIPIKSWITAGLDLMHRDLGFAFDALAGFVTQLHHWIASGFSYVPPYAVIVILAGVMTWRRRFVVAAAIVIGLLVVWNLDLWNDATETVSLVLISVGISAIVGTPLGILMAESPLAAGIVTPVLDY